MMFRIGLGGRVRRAAHMPCRISEVEAHRNPTTGAKRRDCSAHPCASPLRGLREKPLPAVFSGEIPPNPTTEPTNRPLCPVCPKDSPGGRGQRCFAYFHGKPLRWYAEHASDPKRAMALAYASGDYSMKEITAGFGVHYSTVSRAVGAFEMGRSGE